MGAVGMWIGLLGPLRVSSGADGEELPGQRTSVVLASLALSAGRPVSLETLADQVWGEQLPGSAKASLQSLVMRLRAMLGAAAIRTVPAGYLLDIEPDQVDLLRFRRLVDESARAEEPEKARVLLSEALALWRGEPLAGIASDRLRRDVVPGLVEEHLAALERRIALDQEAGRHGDVVAELRDLVARHPLRESLWRMLIVAQDESGRRADALESYHRLREELRERLGVDPSDELRALYRRLLADRTAQPVPTKLNPIRNELPGDAADFTGRARELAELLAGSTEACTVMVSAIDGMAGVGKTTLAVHLAHRLADSFPDGQLFLDLHGHTPGQSPVEPAAALDNLLRSVGVPGERIPDGVNQRAGMWRAELSGRRVLVLLDNAATGAQVRPLIPGAAGCLAIVTSRQRITDLDGAHTLSLDVLPEPDALALFTSVVGAERAAAEPDAVTEVTRLCGNLPLAIRIVAARLRARPAWSVAHLATRLADQRNRLAELTVGERSVAAAFALSYQHLSSAHQRLFRLLGLYPGSSIDAYVAAALTGLEPHEAETLLEDLVDANLLRQPAPDRYQFHDLIRRHAYLCAEADESTEERDEAVHRMLDYYVSVTDLVRRQFAISGDLAASAPTHPPAHLPPIDDTNQAIAWCDAERANLTAVIADAAEHGWDDHVCRLSNAIWWFFRLRGHLNDWITTQTLAVAAASRLDDRRLHADMQRILGNAHWEAERFAEAINDYQKALALYRVVGDRRGQTITRSNIGAVNCRLGQYEDALDYLQRALTSSRQLDDNHYVEASVLANLGVVHQRIGHYRQAIEHNEQAHTSYCQAGDVLAQGATSSVLGLAYGALGEYEKALDCHREAVRLVRQGGASATESEVLNDFGETLRAIGRRGESRIHHEQALELAVETNRRIQQARAHDGIAATLRETDPDAARDHWRQALDIYSDLHLPDAARIRRLLSD